MGTSGGQELSTGLGQIKGRAGVPAGFLIPDPALASILRGYFASLAVSSLS